MGKEFRGVASGSGDGGLVIRILLSINCYKHPFHLRAPFPKGILDSVNFRHCIKCLLNTIEGRERVSNATECLCLLNRISTLEIFVGDPPRILYLASI